MKRFNKKRVLPAVAAALALTFALSACSGGKPADYPTKGISVICPWAAAAVTVNAQWAADNGISDLAGFIDYCKAHSGEVQMGGSSNASVRYFIR